MNKKCQQFKPAGLHDPKCVNCGEYHYYENHNAPLLPAHPSASPASTEALPNAARPMVSGDAQCGDVEIRYQAPDEHNQSAIDEIIAEHAHVHLERMNRGQWSLIITARNQTACVILNGKDAARSIVTAQIVYVDATQVETGNQASNRTSGSVPSAAQEENPHTHLRGLDGSASCQDIENRRLRAYRAMRVFEPSMEGYNAAVAVYEAAFGDLPAPPVGGREGQQ